MEGRTSRGACFSDWPVSLGLGICVILPHSILCRYTLVLASLLLPPAHPPPPSWHSSLDSTHCFLVPVKLLFWKPCFGGNVPLGTLWDQLFFSGNHALESVCVEVTPLLWQWMLCGLAVSLRIFWDALLTSSPGLLPKKLCWTVVYRPFVLM